MLMRQNIVQDAKYTFLGFTCIGSTCNQDGSVLKGYNNCIFLPYKILVIEPFVFLRIKLGACFMNTLQIKQLYQFVQGK